MYNIVVGQNHIIVMIIIVNYFIIYSLFTWYTNEYIHTNSKIIISLQLRHQQNSIYTEIAVLKYQHQQSKETVFSGRKRKIPVN